MTIISQHIDTIGATGQRPRFIYIETDNTNAEVSAAGFLAPLLAQGFVFQSTDMAVVSTKLTPSALQSQVYLYSLAITGNTVQLSVLAPPTSGSWGIGGNSGLPGGTQVFGTLDADDIEFKANNFDYMAFDVATLSLNIVSSNFNVTSSNVSTILSTNVTVDGTATAAIGSLGTPVTTVGNNDLPGNSVVIDSVVVTMPNIPNSVQLDALYYNAGVISFGAAGGGSAGWNLTGTNTGVLVFGTNTPDGWSYVADSIPFATVSALGATTWTGDALFNGVFTVGSPNFVSIVSNAGGIQLVAGTGNIFLNCVLNDIVLNAVVGSVFLSGDTQVNIASGVAGSVNLFGPTITLQSLANVGTQQALYYNSISGLVTYGVSGLKQLDIQGFVFAGPGNYVPSPGMAYCVVECIGGGGGTGVGFMGNAASGAGGGGYCRAIFPASSIGAGVAFVVGAGGSNAGGGQPGTATTFLTMSAGGGGTGSNFNQSSGGTGGPAVNGQVNIAGSDGGSSMKYSDGATTFFASGFGGESALGSRTRGLMLTGIASTNGGNGKSFGSGASGGILNAIASPVGGIGAPGAILITEYIS